MSRVTDTNDMFYSCYLKTNDRSGLDFNGAPQETQNKINALLA
jgi:hypothetical protein